MNQQQTVIIPAQRLQNTSTIKLYCARQNSLVYRCPPVRISSSCPFQLPHGNSSLISPKKMAAKENINFEENLVILKQMSRREDEESLTGKTQKEQGQGNSTEEFKQTDALKRGIGTTNKNEDTRR